MSRFWRKNPAFLLKMLKNPAFYQDKTWQRWWRHLSCGQGKKMKIFHFHRVEIEAITVAKCYAAALCRPLKYKYRTYITL